MLELLNERYRPQYVEDLVLPERIKNKMRNGAYQHLLLVGSCGCGKTTSAKAIIRTFDYPYIYINASVDRGIDQLRDTIRDFCETVGFDTQFHKGDKKIIFLDECDGATPQFWAGLRSFIEAYPENIRFVMTANYINKIPDPILSRFEVIDFTLQSDEILPQKKAVAKRISYILQQEGMTIDKDAILPLIERNFPDMRSIINRIQGLKSQNIMNITKAHVNVCLSEYTDIFRMIFSEPNPIENYKKIMSEYPNQYDDIFAALGAEFIEYIRDARPYASNLIPKITITVADYQYKKQFVIDPNITLLACIFELQDICKTYVGQSETVPEFKPAKQAEPQPKKVVMPEEKVPEKPTGKRIENILF